MAIPTETNTSQTGGASADNTSPDTASSVGYETDFGFSSCLAPVCLNSGHRSIIMHFPLNDPLQCKCAACDAFSDAVEWY